METAADNGQRIILCDELLINAGRVRQCYRHPDNDALVIKVPVGPGKAQQLANLKEQRSWSELVARHGRLSCFSHCHGFIPTDRGIGLVCDAIRNADGSLAETIWDLVVLHEACDLDAIVGLARSFCEYLIQNDIYLFDLNPKNIALPLDASGMRRAVAIDLKGRYDNNEFIPFSTYIPFFARRKVRRRSRQLLERIVFFRNNRERFRETLRSSDLGRSGCVTE